MTSKSSYNREIYVNALQGVLPQTVSYSVLRTEARNVLRNSQRGLGSFDYVDGAAGEESTVSANRHALDDWQIVPSMLSGVDLESWDMTTRALGFTLPSPLVICPIGVQGQLHVDCDVATASASRELGIPYTHSSAASTPLSTVLDKSGIAGDEDAPPAFFQLYWPADEEITASLLSRAKKAGFKVLVVTLDTWALGWRPRDLDKGYNPFLNGEGVANLFSDPVFVKKYCDGQSPLDSSATKDDVLSASIAAIGLLTSGRSRTWSELPSLRELWGSEPIILKGIQSVSDAARAVSAGVQGIWVSNHGGRQVDGAIGSATVLKPIRQYVDTLPETERPSIIFDSGVRSGADIFKALALGADLVGIGRPYAWGLALGGEDGVRAVLRGLMADLELNAALAGARGLDDVRRTTLVMRRGERL